MGDRVRAWQTDALGDPGTCMRLREVPSLDAVPGSVVVEVEACGLNFSDVLMCRGEYQDQPPLPFTPGTEIAGTVLTGAPGTDWSPGDRVVGRASLPHGGLGDQALAHADRILPLADWIDFTTAAALHVNYQSAWFALHRRARLQAGETLLVHAGAGGTGSAAVQLGVAAGARVIATAGGPEKVAVCLGLGAEHAIDYLTEDFVVTVRDLTDGQGADVIFDPVGGPVFDRSRRCAAFEGRIVVVGFASGAFADAATNHLFVKNYGVLGLNWPSYEERRPDLVRSCHDELTRLHREGHLAPLVSRQRPLEEAADALDDLSRRRSTGKVVIHP